MTIRYLLMIFVVLLITGQAYAAMPQISPGYYHVAALTEDGQVLGWGSNFHLQLGDEELPIANGTPVIIDGFPQNIVSLVSGSDHILALDADSHVWSLGLNATGQLGSGSLESSAIPIMIEGLTDVVSISSRSAHSVALKTDGSVWAWGYNNKGQLGSGDAEDTESKTGPVQSQGFENIIAIAAGGAHTLALKNDGSVWAVGSNTWGAVGDGSEEHRFSAVQVAGLDHIIAIGAGSSHSLALKSDGSVWAWGDGSFGQLGTGNKEIQRVPIQVPGLMDVRQVSVGFNASYAIKYDGSLWAWGANFYDSIMAYRGSTDDSSTDEADSTEDDLSFDEKILSPTLFPFPEEFADIDIVGVQGAGDDTYVATYDGRVLSWGRNVNGVLGKGSIDQLDTSLSTVGAVIDTTGEESLNIGQIQLSSELPLLGVSSWDGTIIGNTDATFSGGARSTVDHLYKPSFTANESFDISALIRPETEHLGSEANLYLVIYIVGVGVYQLDMQGNFLLWDGQASNLSTAYQRNLAAEEQILAENLLGEPLGLSGQKMQVFTGYSLVSAPEKIYFHTSPITFRVQ